MPKNLDKMLADRLNKSGNSQLDKSYDSLFGIDDPEIKVEKIEVNKLKPFSKHPFKPYSEHAINELAENIKEQGIFHPIIVRFDKSDNMYEILSGHSRTQASKIVGFKEIDAIVKDADDETAALIVTDSNLRQREKIYPSEKGYAYRLQMEAITNQGKRTDLEGMNAANINDSETCTQIEHKLKAVEKVALQNEKDRNEIRRYIRLTYLISDLLNLVDNEKLPVIAGVELSYLNENQQKTVYEYFYITNNIKIDIKTAVKIRDLSKKGEISTNTLENLFAEKPKKPTAAFSISRSKLKKYSDIIPNDKDLEKLFFDFLDKYYASTKNN